MLFLDGLKQKNINSVYKVLNSILNAYRNDFSKYTDPTQSECMNLEWQSIPSQFAKDYRRFVYGLAKVGARTGEYEMSIAWLNDAGLVRKVYNTKSGDKIPLSTYKDIQAFKLYFMDIGLLRVLSELSPNDLSETKKLFNQFNGMFAEQFILQKLQNHTLYYWISRAQSEVDFVAQINGHVNTY